MEFTQVLQDMIGDLSNAPEPIQIKLFNPNPAVLEDVASRVSDTIKKQRRRWSMFSTAWRTLSAGRPLVSR